MLMLLTWIRMGIWAMLTHLSWTKWIRIKLGTVSSTSPLELEILCLADIGAVGCHRHQIYWIGKDRHYLSFAGPLNA